jgi:hypothetical protein
MGEHTAFICLTQVQKAERTPTYLMSNSLGEPPRHGLTRSSYAWKSMMFQAPSYRRP